MAEALIQAAGPFRRLLADKGYDANHLRRSLAERGAEAVAAACGAQLSRWNQASLSQPGGTDEAASLVTGQPTTPLAEHNAFTHQRALFYVVQARAGRCAPPPVKDGVPEGVPAA